MIEDPTEGRLWNLCKYTNSKMQVQIHNPNTPHSTFNPAALPGDWDYNDVGKFLLDVLVVVVNGISECYHDQYCMDDLEALFGQFNL